MTSSFMLFLFPSRHLFCFRPFSNWSVDVFIKRDTHCQIRNLRNNLVLGGAPGFIGWTASRD